MSAACPNCGVDFQFHDDVHCEQTRQSKQPQAPASGDEKCSRCHQPRFTCICTPDELEAFRAAGGPRPEPPRWETPQHEEVAPEGTLETLHFSNNQALADHLEQNLEDDGEDASVTEEERQQFIAAFSERLRKTDNEYVLESFIAEHGLTVAQAKPIILAVLRGEVSVYPIRPTIPSLLPPDRIPAVLRQLPRWVCWRYEWNENDKRWAKQPYSAQTGLRKEWQQNLSPFDHAHRVAAERGDGIGFKPDASLGVVFLDFDNCLQDGNLDPAVEGWLRFFPETYREVTPSGTGLRVLLRAKLTKDVQAKRVPGSTQTSTVEIYASRNYLTVTGKHWDGCTLVLGDNHQPGLDKLLGELKIGISADSRPDDRSRSESELRAMYAKMLANFRAMVHEEDSQNDQLNVCAWFAARAQNVLSKTDQQLKDELRSIARSTSYCPGIEATLDSGWRSGVAQGAFEILDPEKEHAAALARIDAWMVDELALSSEEVCDGLGFFTDVEYQDRRKRVTTKLNWTASAVDKERAKRRRPTGDTVPSSGKNVSFESIEPWQKSVDAANLLDGIAVLFKRFIIFTYNEDADTLALWALASHCYDCFTIFPRAGITSPDAECGKTTVLDILNHLVARPLRSDNITVAPAFRLVEQHHPTLLVDELDTFLKDNGELNGIFNSGHKQGGHVHRCDKINDEIVVKEYDTFAPMAYGMIGRPATTLGTRSLYIRLLRKKPNQHVEDFDVEENPALAAELTELRRKCARWVADHRDEVKKQRPETPGLANRARDNWRPLFKIASVAGGAWLEKACAAARVKSPRKRESDQVRLLRDIRNIFHTRQTDQITSERLVADLNLQHASGWSRYHNGREPLDQRGLGQLLDSYDLSTTPLWVQQELPNATSRKQQRGYKLEQFADLFERFLPGEEPEMVEVSGRKVHF